MEVYSNVKKLSTDMEEILKTYKLQKTKSIRFEMKSTLSGTDSKLNIANEIISQLENVVLCTIQNKT